MAGEVKTEVYEDKTEVPRKNYELAEKMARFVIAKFPTHLDAKSIEVREMPDMEKMKGSGWLLPGGATPTIKSSLVVYCLKVDNPRNPGKKNHLVINWDAPEQLVNGGRSVHNGHDPKYYETVGELYVQIEDALNELYDAIYITENEGDYPDHPEVVTKTDDI